MGNRRRGHLPRDVVSLSFERVIRLADAAARLHHPCDCGITNGTLQAERGMPWRVDGQRVLVTRARRRRAHRLNLGDRLRQRMAHVSSSRE
jgi:hypothetical protein